MKCDIIAEQVINEEKRRKINILIPILNGVLVLVLICVGSWLCGFYKGEQDNRSVAPIIIPIFFVLLVLILKRISKAGHPRAAALVLIGLILAAVIQTSYTWGVTVPMVVTSYALIIFMSGILIGPKSSIFVTIFVATIMFLILSLQNEGIIKIDSHWQESPVNYRDITVLNAIYLVIAIVSWLSNREIRKSELKAKRLAENLEKQVEKRTRELRDSQLKQLMQVNRLAEYGKISAGLLHDIKNPLTVIAMNLDSIKECSKDNDLNHISNLINKSMLASQTVESIIKSSQKQLLYEDNKENFDVINEIRNVLLLVDHKAQQREIKIIFDQEEKIKISGYPAKLSRVVANLIMNSIDALKEVKKENKKILISVEKQKGLVKVIIEDNGIGIKPENQSKLFSPLFTTKKDKDRVGLGLYISQEIIQKYFGGEIKFESHYKKGTKFIIELPYGIKRKNKLNN